MKKRCLLVSALFMSILIVILALPGGAVVFVDGISGNNANTGLGTWANAKATIGAGVAVAAGQPDLTVWVRKTAYVDSVIVPTGVKVYGGFNGNELPPYDLSLRTFVPATIVQPPAGGTAFTLNGGNVIDGFTIRAGVALAIARGVHVVPGATATVSQCIIQNFQAIGGKGGGILADGVVGNTIGLTVQKTQFSNNAAASGGSIWASNGFASLVECTFSGDLVSDAYGAPPIAGASVYTEGCSLSVLSCSFTNGIARVTAGAITLVQGGAIYASGGANCSVSGCHFDNCVATGLNAVHTAQGGAICVQGVSAMVKNCFVYECAALGAGTITPAYGGAIYFQNPGTLNVNNNTFYDNEVTPNAGLVSNTDRPYGLGSVLYMTGGTTANILNNIITHSRGTAVVNNGMLVNFNYNVIWHNQGGDVFGFSLPLYTTNPATNKDFNIMKDPNLRAPLTGDLHILYGSPAKDAGRNWGAPGIDIDGEARPLGGVGFIDIGADEFVDADDDGGADNDPAETTPFAIVGPAEVDPDGDGVYTPYDNCPAVANPMQTDSNGDRIGDACTPLASGPFASVYFVDGTVPSSGNGLSWATAFKTIQEAIDAADSHNQAGWTKNYEVWVHGNQTYNENPMIWHGVSVYGAWAGTELPTDLPSPYPLRDLNANQTTINGNAVGSSVVMAHLPQDRYLADPLKTSYDNTITVLDGFRVTNGKGELGGGVSVYKDLVNISTCRIVQNTAALGGGVYFYKSNGIVGDGFLPPIATLLSGSTTIYTNTATGAASYAGYGGGVYSERGAPTIFANRMQGNVAFFGGAIASRFSSPHIIENLIGCAAAGERNVAQGDGSGNGKGGGVYMDLNSDPVLDKITLVSNQALGATGSGGGIYVDSSNFMIKNTVVMANSAASQGGAIYATGASAAIADPWCYIRYTVFTNNSIPEFAGIASPLSPPPADSCDQTNFVAIPMFTSGPTCDYSLLPGSPLIGAGDPADGSPNIGAFQDEDPPASVGKAKDLENGVVAEISGVVVTAVFPEGFYVEEQDRTAGIFVRTYNASVKIGQLVQVKGVMAMAGIEREVMNPSVTVIYGSAAPIKPLAMSNRMIGGGEGGLYVEGVTGACGLTNLGLLVKTWGKVTGVQAGQKPHFTLDDGSGVGVKVAVADDASLPSIGDIVVVTGVSCIDYTGSSYGRMLKTRTVSDVTYPLK